MTQRLFNTAVSLHCLRIYLDTSYRMTIDLLKEMPRIIGEIGLNAAHQSHRTLTRRRQIR